MKFTSNPERSTWQALTQRPTADFSSIEPIVDEVFAVPNLSRWAFQNVVCPLLFQKGMHTAVLPI